VLTGGQNQADHAPRAATFAEGSLCVRTEVMGWCAVFLDMLVICEERNCVAWSLVGPKHSRRFA